MSRQLNPAQVWSQVPLASRTSSVIKSIQSGVISVVTGVDTATITAVTTAKSYVVFDGMTHSASTGNSSFSKLVLTNSTTVTATRDGTTGINLISYSVVEFY